MHRAKTENKEKFKVWGTGTPLREFLFVDDLAKAIEFMILENVKPDLYNVGSNEEITIKDLVDEIKNVIEYSGEIIFDDTKPDGNPRKLLDSTKVNALGWKPSIGLEQGLKITYNWFLDNKN